MCFLLVRWFPQILLVRSQFFWNRGQFSLRSPWKKPNRKHPTGKIPTRNISIRKIPTIKIKQQIMVWQFSYKCMAICISKLPIYMPNYIVYRPFFTLVLLPAEKYQCGKVPYGTFPHWYFFRKTLSVMQGE